MQLDTCWAGSRAAGRVLGHVCLVMLRQVRLLSEALAAEGATERLFPGVGADMNVDGVSILETLVAKVTIMEKPRFFPRFVRGRRLRRRQRRIR